MYSSVRKQQDHKQDQDREDARVDDAHRFVAGLEEQLARSRSGTPPRIDRIEGLDSTGTAHAVVDSVGRFLDIGLSPGWWPALGPERVATSLLEALGSARMKAALVPLILRRHGFPLPAGLPLAPVAPAADEADGFLDTARGRLADAYRLIDEAARPPQNSWTASGPRGLFRLHGRGSHIVAADVIRPGLTAADGDRLAADARDALLELSRARPAEEAA